MKYINLIALILVTQSCSLKKFAVRQTVGVIIESKPVIEQERDLALAESAAVASLKTVEGLSLQDPENTELNLFLAEAYAGYTAGFVEDKMEEYEYEDEEKSEFHRQRAIYFYLKARDFAGRELHRLLEVASVEAIDEKLLKSKLKELSKDDVAAVFWYAFTWGSALNLQRDNLEAISHLNKIEVMMAQVKEWDENFFFASAHTFEGLYYGARSKMLGGDPEKSKHAFERAANLTANKMLLVHYFFAKTYCVQYQDYALFKKNIDYILESPLDLYPEQILVNQIAKHKAKRLLKYKDDLFVTTDDSE